MEINIQELITEIPSHVNMVLLIGLMSLGYIIKHVNIFEKVSNKLIPIVLCIVAIIAVMVTSNLTDATSVVIAVINGLVNAAVAVWVHETGKNIFEMKNNTNL